MKEDTFLRPDASGIRGSGLDRKDQRAGDDFPYDKQVSYGQPNCYDRGSNHVGGLHNPLVPMDTSHSAWDELEEALGTPYFFQKAYSGQRGSSVPGGNSSVSWSHPPSHPWDEDDMESELEKYGESAVIPPDAVPPHADVRDPAGEESAAGLLGQFNSSVDIFAEFDVWTFLEKIIHSIENSGK